MVVDLLVPHHAKRLNDLGGYPLEVALMVFQVGPFQVPLVTEAVLQVVLLVLALGFLMLIEVLHRMPYPVQCRASLTDRAGSPPSDVVRDAVALGRIDCHVEQSGLVVEQGSDR